ncbi:sodium/potassium-transporting ATPase subunit alpha, partial [Trichinella spiralis]
RHATSDARLNASVVIIVVK